MKQYKYVLWLRNHTSKDDDDSCVVYADNDSEAYSLASFTSNFSISHIHSKESTKTPILKEVCLIRTNSKYVKHLYNGTFFTKMPKCIGATKLNNMTVNIIAIGVKIKVQPITKELFFDLNSNFFVAKDKKGNFINGKVNNVL